VPLILIIVIIVAVVENSRVGHHTPTTTKSAPELKDSMTALSTQYCTTMLADAACIIAFAHQLSYQGPKHIVGRQAASASGTIVFVFVLEVVVPRRFFWRALETKIRKDTKDIHIGALERYWRAHKRYLARSRRPLISSVWRRGRRG